MPARSGGDGDRGPCAAAVAERVGAAGNLTAEQFGSLYERLRGSVQWGPSDRRGALNHISPAHVVTAASGVRLGRVFSLARLIEHEPAPDNPRPWVHRITDSPSGQPGTGGLEFTTDSISLHIHGDADSHIDALCHVSYDGTCYNDLRAGDASSPAVTELSISAAAADGIVSRAVLLDIPRARGTDWLEPGDQVTTADLAAAEQAEHEYVEAGDVLLVRVGHNRRRRELGPWDVAHGRAGLHPAALEFLADRHVAVLGSDGNSDTAPSAVEGEPFPVHVLAIRALGLHLLDYLWLDDLAAACQSVGRWSFLCVIAPLRMPRATGSPVSPIAVF